MVYPHWEGGNDAITKEEQYINLFLKQQSTSHKIQKEEEEEKEHDKHKRLHKLCYNCPSRKGATGCTKCVFIGNYSEEEINKFFQDATLYTIMKRAFVPAYNWEITTKKRAVFKKKHTIHQDESSLLPQQSKRMHARQKKQSVTL